MIFLVMAPFGPLHFLENYRRQPAPLSGWRKAGADSPEYSQECVDGDAAQVISRGDRSGAFPAGRGVPRRK
jgi:hypothetical protein